MPTDGPTTATEYRFGACRINLSSRELWRGDKLVSTEPKVFDLLVYLIANRDRAVHKNELQDRIWPRMIVTEGALTRCVMKARRAIGDIGEDSQAITTIRGHGYRFTTSVDEIGGSSNRRESLSVPDKPSVVVLPFINIGNDPEQEYFSDGITEDIITELSRFRSLFVIARPSAFSYKGRVATARAIASELGVAYVVDGSVQRASHRIRINVRLVEAATDSQMWAERYDREIEDVFIVQEDLAATIAATIGGRVEVTRGRKRINKDRFESYDCLLRAQSLYYDFRMEANAEARELLQRAIEIDPNNARALALLAAVHSMDSWSYWVADSEESQRLSYEIGKRSIELDDSDSLAHALFGEILYDCGEHALSDHHFERAIALNPNNIAARALYASKLGASGRIKDGLAQLEIAERLDPFGLFWIPLIKASLMLVARRYEDAVAAVYTMTSPPNEARITLLAALGHLGRKDEAAPVLQAMLASARQEMPNYPGDRLEDWQPIINRMRGDPSREEFEHVIEGLRLAGWQ